jgi:hypothetical protein
MNMSPNSATLGALLIAFLAGGGFGAVLVFLGGLLKERAIANREREARGDTRLETVSSLQREALPPLGESVFDLVSLELRSFDRRYQRWRQDNQWTRGLDQADEVADQWWRGVAEVNKRRADVLDPYLGALAQDIVKAVAQVNEARSAAEAVTAVDRLNSLGAAFGDRYSAVLYELLWVDAREAKASWDEKFAV